MKAQYLMISPVITIEEHATARRAATLLRKRHISAVPVVDRAGKLVGIISEADLIRRNELGTERSRGWLLEQLASADALAAGYTKAHAILVKDVMAAEVRTALPTTPLQQVAELMERYHVKRIPITSEVGDLVSILCRANVVQAVATSRPGLQIASTGSAIKNHLRRSLNTSPGATRARSTPLRMALSTCVASLIQNRSARRSGSLRSPSRGCLR